jgi:hypothetical protein
MAALEERQRNAEHSTFQQVLGELVTKSDFGRGRRNGSHLTPQLETRRAD